MRTPLRWARRAAYALAAFDVTVAVLWHQWCRGQGYAELEDELRAHLEAFCGR